jgi:hypothetical protein
MPLNETIVISFKEHITPKKYLDGVDDEHILKYEIYVFDQIGFEKTQLTKTKYTRVVSYRFIKQKWPNILNILYSVYYLHITFFFVLSIFTINIAWSDTKYIYSTVCEL